MDSILNFLADNYTIFIIISVLLLFALVGFVVLGKKKKVVPGEVNMGPMTDQPVGPGGPAQPNVAPAMPAQTVPAPATPATPAPATIEEAQMQMQAQEPVNKIDEPTLVINDPSENPAPAASMAPEMPAPQTLGDAQMGMDEPIRSDEPTLVIPDPSAQQAPADVTNIQ